MSDGDQIPTPQVGIIMGSKSDWPTMKAAAETLEALDIPFESRIVSAHRTPDLLFEYASTARQRGRPGCRATARAYDHGGRTRRAGVGRA